MLIIFTGNGKGKTTASLGQAVRIIGRGKKVLMIQFIKGPWKSGEDFVEIFKKSDSSSNSTGLSQASLGQAKESMFELRKRGLGFVGILGDKLPREDHVNSAKAALHEFRTELLSGNWKCIILDEINVATSLGLLTVQEVLETVKDLEPEKLVIFTGRGAPQEFIDRADLVTEMKEIKHPFNNKILAKIAVEF